MEDIFCTSQEFKVWLKENCNEIGPSCKLNSENRLEFKLNYLKKYISENSIPSEFKEEAEKLSKYCYSKLYNFSIYDSEDTCKKCVKFKAGFPKCVCVDYLENGKVLFNVTTSRKKPCKKYVPIINYLLSLFGEE